MVITTTVIDKINSDINPTSKGQPFGTPPVKIAIMAQSLYLVNLLVLPGLTLILLFYVTWHYWKSSDKLGVCHLRQASILSLWFVLIVIGGTLLIWLVVGHTSPGVSMTILYAIVTHTCFVLLGVLGLANAISGKHFHPTTKNNRCL